MTKNAALYVACAACVLPAFAAEPVTPITITATAETVPTREDDANDVAFWLHPDDVDRSALLVAGGTAGLEVHTLDGKAVARYDAAQIDHVDVRYGFDFGNGIAPIVVAYDRVTAGLAAFSLDPATYEPKLVSAKPLPTNVEITGLCLYRSAASGRVYAFASTDDGDMQQWELHGRDGKVDGRMVRTLPVGVGAGYCAVDDVTGDLYVSEESIGIWKYQAEPESDPVRTLVDIVGPRGNLGEEVKGLAFYRANDAQAYLIASDVAEARYNIYTLGETPMLAGRFTIGAGSGTTPAIDGVEESEGLAITNVKGLDGGGSFAVVDQMNGDEAINVKIVPWSAIAAPLGLASAQGADPRVVTPPSAALVVAKLETEPVGNDGDAADDPAIWVHPTDPSLSLIIATNKKGSLDVHDLTGKRIQSLPDGRMNNVDVREGFMLGGKRVALVAASNRTDKSLALYRVDADTRRLVNVLTAPIPTGLDDPYGLCMYRSAKNGAIYVFVNNSEDGLFRQWRIREKRGSVVAERVRDFVVGSQAEGCVADDETGALYVAEEDVGLWRYSAEPNGGSKRVSIDTVENGRLTDDAEGVALYTQPGGRGYVVLSNQGADNYAVYRREGKNEFVGFFAVTANDELGIDGISETDGLEVTSTPLGPDFPRGLFIAQDGRNITPRARQNYKIVPWEDIAKALQLE